LLAPRVSSGLIDRIGRETSNVFDVRRIHTGDRYAWLMSRGRAGIPLYFIYEINSIDFVVYDFRDSLRVYRDRKPVTSKYMAASGTIETSLWKCFLQNGLDFNLGLAMSDVFQWTVDFYGLQKGDHFKVYYEQILVDSIPISSEHILAALFTSSGRDQYAFEFEQNGVKNYYDEKGQSLRRSFLKAPLHFSRISSRFTRSRFHPILKINTPHFGVDYAAPAGTPVVALGDGHVVEAGWKGGYGRYISIRHNSVFTTSYAHLSGYAKGIHAGAQVKQGDVVGFVGSSGLATGPHLDFRVYRNGQPINPLGMESPPADPVTSPNMKAFTGRTVKLRQTLDTIREPGY